MFKNKVMIVDNFFDNFDVIENHFKKIPLYELKDFREKFNSKESWPGYRSGFIDIEQPFLWNLTIKEFGHKIGDFINNKKFEDVKSFLHLRLDKQNDWIHIDSVDITMITYLSKTNLKSGTAFYDENDNQIADAKFVQNRAVLFDGNIAHSSIQNYGDNIENGRLTMNTFFRY